MIAFLLALLLCPVDVGSTEMAQAEQAYRSDRYARALTLYEAALAGSNAAPGAVLYNLGNCAYRLGKYAEAVLYYQRAKLRLPRDPQVKFNLRLAEQQLRIEAPEDESFGASLVGLVDALTAGELLMAVGGLQAIGLVGIVLARRRRALRNLMALLVLLALAGAVRLVRDQWFPGPPAGVVLAREIGVRAEPRLEQEAAFELRAGELVYVEELSDRWVRIVHADGAGWAERGGVGVVD